MSKAREAEPVSLLQVDTSIVSLTEETLDDVVAYRARGVDENLAPGRPVAWQVFEDTYWFSLTAIGRFVASSSATGRILSTIDVGG